MRDQCVAGHARQECRAAVTEDEDENERGRKMQIGRGMSEGELKKALCGMAEAPVAKGVLAMLDMRIMDGVMAATDPALSDKETAMWLGETRALVSFKEDLVGWLQQERDA